LIEAKPAERELKTESAVTRVRLRATAD
jgi:hypothetical protein